jgi:hypothetical protein
MGHLADVVLFIFESSATAPDGRDETVTVVDLPVRRAFMSAEC